jgi:hypothetical protein
MTPEPLAGSTSSTACSILAPGTRGPRSTAAAAIVAGCIALVVGACSDDSGYVEVRTSPPSLSAAPLLYLGTTRLEPRNGATVLRQAVGTMQLQGETGGQMILLCDVVVRKNRITTVTVSLVDRPPRCQCRTDVTAKQRAGRVCIA